MRWTADLNPADWISSAPISSEQLIQFGPAVFSAWGRLRFIPDPSEPGQQEADVELAEHHLPDVVQVQRALHILAAFTQTPHSCFFAVWEGYSDIPMPTTDAARLVIPHRRYLLLTGPLTGIDTFGRDWGTGGLVAPPAFIWPRDRRWCLASDVDPHWAGVGADQPALDALMADSLLDVVPADPRQKQPTYY